MKKLAIGLSVCALLAGGVFLYVAYRLLFQPLRTPTAQQFQTAFPNDTRAVFENSDRFVLLSLDPELGGMPTKLSKQNEFHGFRILGQTTLTDPEIRDEIRRAYYDGIADTTGWRKACFSPRHGIRATSKNETLDLVICFSCSNVRIYPDAADDGEKEYWSHIGESPRATFDRVLAEHGVPLDK